MGKTWASATVGSVRTRVIARLSAGRAQEKLAPDTRIIILTAKDSRSDAVYCWELGADEYLQKPFDGDRLIKLVSDLMNLSTEQLRHRREVGLEEARRLDAIDEVFRDKR